MLDASALLALIGDEPGAERVRPLLSSSAIAAVNLAEVVKKLREKRVPLEEIRVAVSDIQIPLETGPADERQAIQLGEIVARGRAFGLSMGDAICLATAAWVRAHRGNRRAALEGSDAGSGNSDDSIARAPSRTRIRVKGTRVRYELQSPEACSLS